MKPGVERVWDLLVTLVLFVFQLVVTVIGWFLLLYFTHKVEPFECVSVDSRPTTKFKNPWIDFIFGNINDGLEGDAPYRAKYKGKLTWWTRYNWCALRNPINNLKLHMGVDEVVVDYKWEGFRYTEDRIGKEGFVYSEATGLSGEVYPMYRWCKLFKTSEVIYNILTFIGSCYNYIEQNVIGVYKLVKELLLEGTLDTNRFKKFEFAWETGIGIEANIGYKNFNVVEVGKHYVYSFTVSVNPIKRFER